LGWGELHARLAVHGVRLVRRGNGLALVDATRPNLACKASALGRAWSKQRLSERYGDFVPGPEIAQVARGPLSAYVERPLGQARDDGLWREYQDALGAARVRRQEQREALSSKIDAARAAHRRHFKLRHHAIAAMPVSGADKRKLYKLLSFERMAAKRKLGQQIQAWRMASSHPGPGSWKEFLASRAARGDRRAIRQLARYSRAPGIRSGAHDRSALPARDRRTSRGSIVHRLPGGVRLRESAGSIELLGDARDDALEQLVRLAGQRFGGRRVTLLGPRATQARLAEMAAERGLDIAEERQR